MCKRFNFKFIIFPQVMEFFNEFVCKKNEKIWKLCAILVIAVIMGIAMQMKCYFIGFKYTFQYILLFLYLKY